MQVEIRTGGDGVSCWNADATRGSARAVDAREAAVAAANPDVRVMPGQVTCYGCEVMEYDMGTRCTASLIKTLYAVADEVSPRAADADGSLSEIAGLVTRIDPDPAQPPSTPGPEWMPAPTPDRPRGLRGLLGRRG